MNDRLINTVRSAIFEVLAEETEKSEKPEKVEKPEKKDEKKKDEKKKDGSNRGVISTKGAFGSGGRAKRFVSEAGARAEKDPKGLMKELGVTGAASGDDLGKTIEIINTAIHSNAVMSAAYVGAIQMTESPGKDQDPIEVISVKVGQLDRKNGIRFLSHTLKAAQNAGFLSLSGGIQFAQGQDSIVLYSF